MNETLTTTTASALLITADSLILEYLASLDVKPRTKETYQKALRQYAAYLKDKGITQPTRLDILAYKNYLIANFTASTTSSYLTAVKSFYRYLEASNMGINIANGIKGAKNVQGFKKDALTIEQAKKILKGVKATTLEGKRDYALINLLIHTGLRTIEAARADVSDIRQEAGEALLYIQGKGRDSKDAYVLLTEATLQPLRAYLKARDDKRQDAPLFASTSDRNKGERLTTRSLSRIVKSAMQKVGIDSERLTAHSLRHSAVTFSLLAGATIQEAQKMARHSNINTTMIYSHNIDRINNAAERKIAKLLKS